MKRLLQIGIFLLVFASNSFCQRSSFLQAEMKALQVQMNSYFIFNYPYSITRFILENKPEAATGEMVAPPLLFEPFVENATGYGLIHKEEQRMEMLGNSGEKASLQIVDLKDKRNNDQGTEVIITIPVKPVTETEKIHV